MKRFVYRLSFIPKIPVPNVASDRVYRFTGDFFLISPEKYILIDLQINDQTCKRQRRLHVAEPFQAVLTREQDTALEKVFFQASNSIYARFARGLFEEKRTYLIPVHKAKDQTTWDSTLDWACSFMEPINVKDLYLHFLIKYDKKNQGQKLKAFLKENGTLIDRITNFIMHLEVPVEEYIKNNPDLNEDDIDHQTLVAVVTALKFNETIMERMILTKYKGPRTFLVKSVTFRYTGDTYVPSLKMAPSKYLKQVHNMILEDPEYPVVFCVNSKNPENVTDSASNYQFPRAYSMAHQRVNEAVSNHSLIKALIRKIPQDLEFPHDGQFLPFEICYFTNFPRLAINIAHYANNLGQQIAGIAPGKPPLHILIENARNHIESITGYRFKNGLLLGEAFVSSASYICNTSFMKNYQRIEFLGDAVLDLIVNCCVFNCNNNADEEDMTKTKFRLVSNHLFRELTEELGLLTFLVGGPTDQQLETAKTVADLFECLFGALFLDSDLMTCFRVFKKILREHEAIFQKEVKGKPTGEMAIRYCLETDNPFVIRLDLPQNVEHPASLSDFEERIGLDLKKSELPYFKLAFVHESKKLGYDYNRLEYLGDTLVKFAYTVYLYHSFPTTDEGGMTIVISYYKSNAALGRIAHKLRFHELLYANEENKDHVLSSLHEIDFAYAKVHKVMGDLIEATTGAICITRGIKIAIDWLKKHVIGDSWTNRASSPVLDPKSELYKVTAIQFSGAKPSFTCLRHQGDFIASFNVGDARIPLVGQSNDKASAEMKVSIELLEKIKENEHFLEERIEEMGDCSEKDDEIDVA